MNEKNFRHPPRSPHPSDAVRVNVRASVTVLPSGIYVDCKAASKFKTGNTAFALGDMVNCPKPGFQRQLGGMEYRSSSQ